MKTCEICGDAISSGTTNNICSYCISAEESTTAAKDSPTPNTYGYINTASRNCPLCNKPLST